MVLPLILSSLLLCVAVQAAPVVEIHGSLITLPIAVRINVTGGMPAVIEADRARFAALRAQYAPARIPLAARNTFVTYTCEIPIGSPPTSYELIVDTGSSNTWVGATRPYFRTSTSLDLGQAVSVEYGSGSFNGEEYLDTVTIGSAAITQSIGAASSANGFSDVDGILGLGPADLTLGTLSPNSSSLIPTVADNLKSQGFVKSALLGVSFTPTTANEPSLSGQLDFGGADHSKYSGSIDFVPVTSISPSSLYWGITQGITYGASTTIINPGSAGIVDTGTTLLYLPHGSFLAYANATGATMDGATGLLKISREDFARLKSLHFMINGVSYEFTANAQIWPRHLNTLIGGEASGIYLVVADSQQASGTGFDFINGFVWLQRFYTVYDTDNSRIGIAKTRNTYANTN